MLLLGFGMVAAGCARNRVEEPLAGAVELSIDACDPATGSFTAEITNPYLPVVVGRSLILEGREGSSRLRVEISGLAATADIAGVTTRVFEEREWVNGALVEVSRNFVAQALDGSVCYFGEEVDDYRDGEIVGHEGAWRAGEDGASAGILMPGKPRPGVRYVQEVAPGVAEDEAVIVAVGQPFSTPAGDFTDTVVTSDVDPLSGGVDAKRYARGVGLIVDETLVLTGSTG